MLPSSLDTPAWSERTCQASSVSGPNCSSGLGLTRDKGDSRNLAIWPDAIRARLPFPCSHNWPTNIIAATPHRKIHRLFQSFLRTFCAGIGPPGHRGQLACNNHPGYYYRMTLNPALITWAGRCCGNLLQRSWPVFRRCWREGSPSSRRPLIVSCRQVPVGDARQSGVAGSVPATSIGLVSGSLRCGIVVPGRDWTSDRSRSSDTSAQTVWRH